MDAPEGFVAWPITARNRSRSRGKSEASTEEVEEEGDEDVEGGAEAEELLVEPDAEVEAEEADLLPPDVAVDMEVDLDRGLREEAATLPRAEVADPEAKGMPVISRTKVIEALLKRGRFTSVWERLPLEAAPWERRDCPNPEGSQVPTLAYGLESIVGLRGSIVPLALLPLEQRRDLRLVAQVEDIDPGAMPTFVPPWRDARLQGLALERSCRFFSSTSSLTGLLSKCYFAISRHCGVDIVGLSSCFKNRRTTHGPSTRIPTVVILRRTPCGQAWSISAAPYDLIADEEEDNVLSQLGLTMEHQVKMSKADFDAHFRRRAPDAPKAAAAMEEEEAQAYRFLEVGPFMMRSQLDARHEDQIFDLKTRAVAPIRYNTSQYEKHRKYRIGKLLGPRKSYELEIYDMMRLAFLKYGFQARIGRMDGVFVTYHNTVEVFGFQYIPLADMDRCIYGGHEPANVAFDLSSKTLSALMEMLVQDTDLSRTGTIKVMFCSDTAADDGSGSALDLAAAPVHAADTPSERLDTVRRWRVLVDVEGPDGEPHPAHEPLKEGLTVHLTAKEVLFGAAE